MGFHDHRKRKDSRPKSASQIQKEIDALEFRLETEALKYSEEKRIRGLVKDLKKQKVLASRVVTIKPKSQSEKGTIHVKRNEVEETLVSDFANKLRAAREKRGMTQEKFAAFLNQRESVVSKWENGSLIPNIGVAKGLSKKLKMNLVVEGGVQVGDPEEILKSLNISKSSKTATLGDMVKLKVRKR